MVLGDIITSPLFSFVLLRGQSACSITDLDDLLKAAKFMDNFSSVTVRVKHLEQTWGGSWSVWFTGISQSSEILDGHVLSSDFLVKMLVTVVRNTFSTYSLHNKTSSHCNITKKCRTENFLHACCMVLCSWVPAYREWRHKSSYCINMRYIRKISLKHLAHAQSSTHQALFSAPKMRTWLQG